MTREDFFRLVWSTPITEIATIFNVMPSDVRKLAELFELPSPGKGHWMQTDGRQSLAKARPLPPHSRPEILPSAWPLQKPGKVKSGRYGLFVPQALPKTLHPVARATAAAIRQAPNPISIVVDAPGTFPCQTKAEDVERAVRFIDALLKLFDRLGFAISSDDVLEVQCFGVWFAFDLTYRSLPAGRDRSKNDKKVLEVQPLSPAFVGRQWGAFYGRGDKPIEATFNTILLWLMHTARGIVDAEAAWTDARLRTEGTTAERFYKRRDAAEAAARKKEALEIATAKAERERAEVEARREEAAERERSLRDPKTPLPDGVTLIDLEARQAARTQRDPLADMSKQAGFLWLVQTILLARLQLPEINRDDVGSMQSSTAALLRLSRTALSVSYLIPRDVSAALAAQDFLCHFLPEGEEARADEDYWTPEWMGEPTVAEREALFSLYHNSVISDEDEKDV